MQTRAHPSSAAKTALLLLLGVNLFNYIDRYVLAAVEPEIQAHFFAPDDPNAHALTGLLGTAFLVTYMISAPIFGWLADRMSRWLIIGAA
jgi:MFS family permease